MGDGSEKTGGGVEGGRVEGVKTSSSTSSEAGSQRFSMVEVTGVEGGGLAAGGWEVGSEEDVEGEVELEVVAAVGGAGEGGAPAWKEVFFLDLEVFLSSEEGAE